MTITAVRFCTGYDVGKDLPSCACRFVCSLVSPVLYKTLSAAVYGIDANIIGVEVDVSSVKT